MTQTESFLRDSLGHTQLFPKPEHLPSWGRWAVTYGIRCAWSSHTTPCPDGRRSERTPGGQHTGTSCPGHTYTESFHTGPQKARDPPEGGSGRTPRQSSKAGTAPMGPARTRCHLSEGSSVWPWLFSVSLTVLLSGALWRPSPALKIKEVPYTGTSDWYPVGAYRQLSN